MKGAQTHVAHPFTWDALGAGAVASPICRKHTRLWAFLGLPGAAEAEGTHQNDVPFLLILHTATQGSVDRTTMGENQLSGGLSHNQGTRNPPLPKPRCLSKGYGMREGTSVSPCRRTTATPAATARSSKSHHRRAQNRVTAPHRGLGLF